MAIRRLIVILLTFQCFQFIYCDDSVEIVSKLHLNNASVIGQLLNELKTSENQYFNYKTVNLINAQIENESQVEVNFNVQVECISKEQQCNTDYLFCKAFYKYETESTFTIIPYTVSCQLPQDFKNPSPETVRPIDSSDNAEPIVGEGFVAPPRRDYCAGCPVDLNVNVPGIDNFANAALAHIEKEREYRQRLVKVLRVQRQVLETVRSGVKYVLLIEIAETSCPKGSEVPIEECVSNSENNVLCEVKFMEKPTLSKSKHIIYNNCTLEQEYFKESDDSISDMTVAESINGKRRNDMDNEIEVNYDVKKPYYKPDNTNQGRDSDLSNRGAILNYDSIAENGRVDDILKFVAPELEAAVNPALRDLESQIIKKTEAPVATERFTDDTITDEGQISQTKVQTELFALPTVPISSDKAAAIEGLLDAFDFDEPPKFHKAEQNPGFVESRPKAPVIEDLIVPVRAVVRFKEPSSMSPQMDTVIVGVTDSEIDQNTNNPQEQQTVLVSSVQKLSTNDDTFVQRKKRAAYAKQELTDDDEKPYVNALAELAVLTLDNIDTDNHKRIVLKILGSKKTHTDGYTYYLTLKVGVSECTEYPFPADLSLRNLKKESTKDLEDCSKKLLSDLTMICKVQIHVTEEKTEPKVVKSQCQNVNKATARSNYTGQRFDQQHPVTADRKKRETISNKRSKRQVPGGVKNFEENENSFGDLLVSALEKLDRESSGNYRHKVTNVKKATEQVVAGKRYTFDVEVILSDIPKSKKVSYNELKLANTLENERGRLCHIEIWDRPWLPNGREITTDCKNLVNKKRNVYLKKREKRDRLVGAPTAFDESDEDFKKFAVLALNKLDQESGNSNKYTIVNVKGFTKQVVAGTLYKMELEVGLSEIPTTRNDVLYDELRAAKLLSDPKPKHCEISVWHRAWLKEGGTEITNKCHDKNRKKRSVKKHLLGGDDVDITVGMFHDFINKFNKRYFDKMEYKRRFKIFKHNLKTIEDLNNNEQGTAKYGPTQFADLTKKEFKRYLGLNLELRNENAIPFPMADIPHNPNLPTQFDWRDKGVVTAVKNQGMCGSCWAFSVTGNVEGQYAIKSGKLIELSEQELVDCDKLDDGCEGGLPDNAYRAIEQMGGLETEGDYPYDAKDESCHFNKSLSRVQVVGAVNITKDEKAMQQWLYAHGPISIGINANAMQFYMGGVSHPWKSLCSPKDLDHGVLIVGYGVHNYPLFHKTLPFWIIKNSWGPKWGEQGYYRLYRGDGTCGVDQMASSAIVAD